ncbi:hypothetical protein CerSpe_156410 [Prunus speciosa]
MSPNFTSSFALYPSPCPSLPLPPNLQCFYKPKRKQSVSSIRAGPEESHLQIAKPQIVRPTANYHPNVWGDRFINYEYSDDNITHAHYQKQVDELKEIVRREVFTNLKAGGDGFALQLKLIDAIQRLGVAYHFEREIEEALERIHGTTYHDNYDGDLHSVALGFRLLRQHGYNVSCGRYIPRLMYVWRE